MKLRKLLLLPVLLSTLVGGVVGWRWWHKKRHPVKPETMRTGHAALKTAPLRDVVGAGVKGAEQPSPALPIPTALISPYLLYLRLAALPLIFWLAYEAQQRFDRMLDGGFYWLAAAGAVLLLITPRLPAGLPKAAVTLNLAGQKRLIVGGAVWLVGVGFLGYAASLFLNLQEGQIPDARPWNFYAAGLLLWITGGLILTRSQYPRLAGVSVWLPTLVFALAAVMRLYDFESQPPGIWFDEAINGLEARKILHFADHRPIFVPNITAPHLALYAIGLKVFGETSITGPRLWSAFFGIGTAVLAFLVGRQLRGPYFGLLFALMMAVMRWSINFSRIAMTGVEMGFFTLLALYFTIRLVRYGQLRDALFIGLSLGAGLWFYSAFRVLMFTVVLYGILAWRRWPSRKAVLLAAVIGLTALAVIFPLLTYAKINPDTFFERTRGVTIFSDKARDPERSFEDAFRSNLKVHARMFHLFGDRNGRHNDPGEPMLDPYTGLLFGIGLVLAVRFIHRPETIFFVALLAAGLSGGVLTFEFEAPQALRSIGVLPAIGYFAALAAWSIGYTVYRSLEKWPQVSKPVLLAAGGVLALLVTQANFTAYFEKQRRDFASFYDFTISETLMGNYAAKQPADTRFYVAPLLAYYPIGEFVDAQPEKWTPLPVPDAFPLRIAPDYPVTAFLHFLDVEQFKYAQEIYPHGQFITVRPSDYGVDEPEFFPVLFYIVSLQPQDIASVQGWVEQGDTAEGYLYAPYSGEYRFWFEKGTGLTINGQEISESGEAVTLPDGNLAFQMQPTGAVEWITPDDDRRRLIPKHQFYHEPVNGHGLLAEFYPNLDWQGTPIRRSIQPDIYWRMHVLPLPHPFSIRWTGTLIVPETGDYQFELNAAPYGELSIDGVEVTRTVIERRPSTGRIHLEAGEHQIEVKFRDNEGHSGVFLSWIIPGSQQLEPVLRDQFRPQ